jgi:hypothetical protein
MTCRTLQMSSAIMVRTLDKGTGRSTLSVRSIQIRTNLAQPTSIRISLYALPVAFRATAYK